MTDNQNEIFLRSNIKGLLQTCLTTLNDKQKTFLDNGEFKHLRAGDVRLFGQLRGRELTISELAREMDMSRQGAQQAIQRLQQEDMVELTHNAVGSKGKVIHITEKGQEYRQLIARYLQEQESEMKNTLGESELEQLRERLQQLNAYLHK